jgi:VWFA-related protein
VVATVTDERGRYVSGLKAEDFILEEDGKRQEIVHFTPSRDLPVSVGIVLDTSGSMERKITTASRAIDRFIRDIHEDDDMFLMTFDDRVRVRQDFTADRERLAEALYRIRLGNGTALYDGLVAGLEKIQKGKHTKKAILLLSDGYDTSSDDDFDAALRATRESEVLVYCLGIAPEPARRDPLSERPPVTVPGGTPPGTGPRFPIPGGGGFPIPIPNPIPGRRFAAPQGPRTGQTMPSMDSIDMDVLDAIAETSGGSSWLINAGEGRTEEIRDALETIADELRNQYTLGYYPGHGLKDGQWHRIEIRTRNPNYRVRTKRDYFGG